MDNFSEMFSFSSKLWFNSRRVSKDNYASLYLQVVIDGKHKEFPLKLKWPVAKVDVKQNLLLPRFKGDPDVSDFNLIIEDTRAKHHKIYKDYRVREQPLDMAKFARELVVFNDRDCFLTFMETEAKRRYTRKEIDRKTFQNANATRKVLARYDPESLFKNIDLKWMKRFKIYLQAEKYKPGTIWARVKEVKTYLKLASLEPMIYVRPEAVSFPNPKVATDTTFLEEDEVRRLMILSRNGGLTMVQENVLKAFLFTCFTSLRISDVYRINSNWLVSDGVLKFIPKKNEKRGKFLTIKLMPMANAFVMNLTGKYFTLPTEQEYNRTLKDLAKDAEINKRLTSHVGRHTFGALYMTANRDIHGLQEVMGHSKMETTQRYAHLGDDYQKQAVKEIQNKFSDLIIRKIK